MTVINVMTASGGAGGTTIAINLADELRARAGGRRVVLVDLDLQYGAASAYLGLAPERSIADVLDHEGTLARGALEAAASVFLDDLHVLASPAGVDFDEPREARLERLPEALAACRDAYAHTVVDAPRLPRGVAAALAATSDLTLVVFQLTVVGVRRARAMLRSLAARDVPSEKVLPVANRFDARARLLTLEDATDALGTRVASVANDFAGVVRSINYGRPLAAVAPRSVVRRDLGVLVGLAGAGG